ncbi:MAG: hypothetical protein GX573_01855 [Chloroflexi bacterium]|nr:hypothetical protein [Chloroflexota bacterium]HMN12861.1 hypothetical protein [Bellilinea sp.]
MQISIQLTPDGRRFEFDLVPDGEMWRLNPVGRSPVNRCNEAGLTAAFQLARQSAERTAKERERELKRCRWDLPWQCPHYPHMPCRKPRTTQNRRNLAVISTSHYESVLQPVGQMSLFEPGVTHRRVWKHCASGEVIDAPLRPFSPALTVCKQMAVATMEWLKRDQGWRPLAWKIRPMDQTKAGEAWADEMAGRYEGKYQPCMFHLM